MIGYFPIVTNAFSHRRARPLFFPSSPTTSKLGLLQAHRLTIIEEKPSALFLPPNTSSNIEFPGFVLYNSVFTVRNTHLELKWRTIMERR